MLYAHELESQTQIRSRIHLYLCVGFECDRHTAKIPFAFCLNKPWRKKRKILWTPASFFIRLLHLMQSAATLYSLYKHLHLRRLPDALIQSESNNPGELHFSDDQLCSQPESWKWWNRRQWNNTQHISIFPRLIHTKNGRKVNQKESERDAEQKGTEEEEKEERVKPGKSQQQSTQACWNDQIDPLSRHLINQGQQTAACVLNREGEHVMRSAKRCLS